MKRQTSESLFYQGSPRTIPQRDCYQRIHMALPRLEQQRKFSRLMGKAPRAVCCHRVQVVSSVYDSQTPSSSNYL